MINVNVKVDIERALRKFDLVRDDATRAIPRALNRTLTTAQAQAAREIVDAGYGLKVGAIKKSLDLTRATPNRLTAILRATGRPIPLINYGARQTAAGVTVNVLHGRKLIPGAFIATMPSGHEGVFVRVGSSARLPGGVSAGKAQRSPRGAGGKKHGLPIRELYGPSIPKAFGNRVVRDALTQAVKERFPTALDQELRYLKLRRR
jgi:hypothetical protein